MNINSKKALKIGGVSVFFLIIVVFGFFRSYDLIFGLKIKNVSIVDGAKSEESAIKVTGNAKNAVHLTINGREISINQKGDFDETIALLSGYNIVSIVAKDKFGYIDEKNYKLMH